MVGHLVLGSHHWWGLGIRLLAGHSSHMGIGIHLVDLEVLHLVVLEGKQLLMVNSICNCMEVVEQVVEVLHSLHHQLGIVLYCNHFLGGVMYLYAHLGNWRSMGEILTDKIHG